MTAVDLPQLQRELDAAGVPVPYGLATLDGTLETVKTIDPETAQLVDLPPEADPVLAAHVAPPRVVEFVGTTAVDAVTRTNDGAFREIWRLPTKPKHIYRAALEMRATDATDGTSKAQEARLLFKGLAASAVQVGSTVALWAAQDAAATGWVIQAQVQGMDLVFGVRGAAGKTIDWSLAGQLVTFAPEGLES